MLANWIDSRFGSIIKNRARRKRKEEEIPVIRSKPRVNIRDEKN